MRAGQSDTDHLCVNTERVEAVRVLVDSTERLREKSSSRDFRDINRTDVKTPVEPTTPCCTGSISVKVAMALTGAGLILFVSVHMLGNLQIYLGQDAINAYAKKLKDMPVLLWVARSGLIAIFVAHIALAITLKIRNQVARPRRYEVEYSATSTLASRTMTSSGLVILAFLIYHLLHFTFGVTDPQSQQLVDARGRHDVYSMVVLGFQNVYVSVAYLVAMVFLGLHLSHAAFSIPQTLGLATAKTRIGFHYAGVILAAIITIGNISIPVAVLAGYVGLPPSGPVP